MPIHGQVPLELRHNQLGQQAGAERALLHRLRGFLCRDDLAPVTATRAGVGVAHVLDDVRFGRLNLQPFGHALADDDALLAAVAAGTFFLRQWILDPLPRQELWEHDPFFATLQRSVVGWWRLFVGRFLEASSGFGSSAAPASG
jgi:hypothetical protein